MPKKRNYYKCEECGYKSTNWMGRCSNCGSWNSFIEIEENNNEDKKNKKLDEINPGEISFYPLSEIQSGSQIRYQTGFRELDRVLGGGIVSGSLILFGGAPGIGKSTLILQVASLFSNTYGKVLYVSGEESCQQIKLRAERLGIINDKLMVLAETEMNKIRSVLKDREKFELIVIDSVQTIYDSRIDTNPGSISQIKEITNILMKFAKTSDIPVILIGHITKRGKLAGPKVLEHLVDTVLQIEGDRNYIYRILRSIKNRFGSTNEIGVFEMRESGMKEIKNPSQLFLEERDKKTSGSVIVPTLEGSRTILVEVQALVSSATFSTSQRLTTGIDKKRVSILLAVLEKKAGFSFQDCDVHLNITGGLKVREPALDLAIVTSIISSYRDISIDSGIAVVGEIGLAGEIRAVSQIEKRINEVKKLGFKEIILPQGNGNKISPNHDISLKQVKNINEVLDYLFN
ncbi:MAG: DNA repair protein RadA [Bacillota bacterium]